MRIGIATCPFFNGSLDLYAQLFKSLCIKGAAHLKEQDNKAIRYALTIGRDSIPHFLPLLQQGFQVTAKVGCDVQSLLCDQFGLMPDYLAERISTVFLNHQPVDDLAATVVGDGATLALSASMPGLVGATFRKAGCLAAFRGTITYRDKEEGPAACFDGCVTLKLFNLLIEELGPRFLERGIWISADVLHDFWARLPAQIQMAADMVASDGGDPSSEKIGHLDWIPSHARVFLRAICES